MSVDISLILFYGWFILLATTIVCLAIALILHLCVPKIMAQTYFREPYFSRAEIAIYSAFPFNYFKVFMFMRLAGWPSSGEKRGLTEAYKLAPLWFQRLSRVFIRVYLVIFALLMILMVLSAITFYFFG
jgi:hypothetical protein